jgi:hypothetical protein
MLDRPGVCVIIRFERGSTIERPVSDRRERAAIFSDRARGLSRRFDME